MTEVQYIEIINLLNSLPDRICDEMDRRRHQEKADREYELQQTYYELQRNYQEINSMLFDQRFNAQYVVTPDNPEDAEVAKQYSDILNHAMNTGIGFKPLNGE